MVEYHFQCISACGFRGLGDPGQSPLARHVKYGADFNRHMIFAAGRANRVPYHCVTRRGQRMRYLIFRSPWWRCSLHTPGCFRWRPYNLHAPVQCCSADRSSAIGNGSRLVFIHCLENVICKKMLTAFQRKMHFSV